MNASGNRAWQLTFYVALALIVAGAGILLFNTGGVDGLSELWPLATFLAGIFYCHLAGSAVRRGRTLFPGILVSLASVVHLGVSLAGLPPDDYWPMYVIVVGLSLALSGWLGYRRARANYLVPSLSFMLLGAFFLVFSLGFSTMSFRSFLSQWWPGLLVSAGIILFVLYYLMRAIAPSAGKGSPRP